MPFAAVHSLFMARRDIPYSAAVCLESGLSGSGWGTYDRTRLTPTSKEAFQALDGTREHRQRSGPFEPISVALAG